MDDHKSKASESPDLFRGLDDFIFPLVFKAIFALYCKYDIGDHDNRHDHQAKDVQPIHKILLFYRISP